MRVLEYVGRDKAVHIPVVGDPQLDYYPSFRLLGFSIDFPWFDRLGNSDRPLPKIR
jgi:hypothetical protein